MDVPIAQARRLNFRFWAFISYSSSDRAFAKWLHHSLESYSLPVELVSHSGRALPKRLKPLFWDRAEMSAHHDLGQHIRDSLRASRFLIVICSPNSAKSKWVDQEIVEFREMYGVERILTVILDGSPDAADDTNCFPPALRDLNPKAPDVRKRGDGRNNAKLMLLASMLGVRFDDLARRDARRRKTRLIGMSGIAMVVLAMLGSLALKARQSTLLAGSEQTQRRHVEYLNDMNAARVSWDQGDVQSVTRLVGKYEGRADESARGFEWRYWKNLLKRPEPAAITVAGAAWRTIAAHPTQARLAAIDGKGVVSVWDTGSRKELYHLEVSARSVEFTRDGKSLVVFSGSEILTFDGDAGRPNGKFKAAPLTTAIAVSPDAKHLVMGGIEGSVVLADFPSGENGKVLNNVYHREIGRELRSEEDGMVSDVVWRDDGYFFATAHEDGKAVIWSPEQGSMETGKYSHAFLALPHEGPVTGVAFSPDARTMVSQACGLFDNRKARMLEGGLIAWNAATGVSISKSNPHGAKAFLGTGAAPSGGSDPQGMLGILNHEQGRFRPVFVRNDRRVFTTGERGLQIWDTLSGTRLGETHRSGPAAAVVANDAGTLLASISGDTILVSNPAETTCCREIAATDTLLFGIALSPDEKTVAVVREGDGDRGVVFGSRGVDYSRSQGFGLAAWSAAGGGRPVLDVEAVNTLLPQPVFDKDGRNVGSGSQRFNVSTGEPATGAKEGSADSGGMTVRASDGSFEIRAVEVDGNERKRRVELLKPASGSSSELWTGPEVVTMKLSPDDSFAAVAARGGRVRVWRMKDTGRIVELATSVGEITSLAFSPDGQRLAVGGMERVIQIWDLGTRELTGTLTGHRREVSGLVFTPDGKRLVSSSGLPSIAGDERGEVRIWEVAGGRLCVELPSDRHEVYGGVVIDRDGKRIYASACDPRIQPNEVLMLWSPGGQRLLPPKLPDDQVAGRIICWEAP